MADARKSEVYRRWDDGFVVRRMRSDEIQQVFRWYNADNRFIGHELEVLLELRGRKADVDGLYVGELNGEMVASLVVTQVADDLRYLGYLYVVERLQRSGIGARMILTARGVEQPRNCIVCLNTLPPKESLFAKFDYETTCRMCLYRGVVSTDVSRNRCGTDIRQVSEKKNIKLVVVILSKIFERSPRSLLKMYLATSFLNCRKTFNLNQIVVQVALLSQRGRAMRSVSL